MTVNIGHDPLVQTPFINTTHVSLCVNLEGGGEVVGAGWNPDDVACVLHRKRYCT